MIKLQTGKRDILVPQGFKELTYKEMLGLKRKADEGALLDEFEIMNVLTGLSLDVLERSASAWHSRIEFEDILSGVSLLLNKQEFKRQDMQVLNKKVKPKSYAACKFSQRLFLSNLFKGITDNNLLELMPRALAICIAPQAVGDSWADEIDLVEADLWECPAYLVYENAAFFLSSSMIMRSNGTLSLGRWMRHGLTLLMDRLRSMAYSSSAIN